MINTPKNFILEKFINQKLLSNLITLVAFADTEELPTLS